MTTTANTFVVTQNAKSTVSKDTHRQQGGEEELATKVYETSPCQVWACKLHQNPTFSIHYSQNTKSMIQNAKSSLRITKAKFPNPSSYFHKYQTHHHTTLSLQAYKPFQVTHSSEAYSPPLFFTIFFHHEYKGQRTRAPFLIFRHHEVSCQVRHFIEFSNII